LQTRETINADELPLYYTTKTNSGLYGIKYGQSGAELRLII